MIVLPNTDLLQVSISALTTLTMQLLITVFGTTLTLLNIVVMKVPSFGAIFTNGETEPQQTLINIFVVLVKEEFRMNAKETMPLMPTFTNRVVLGLASIVCTVPFTPAHPMTIRKVTTKTIAARKTRTRREPTAILLNA